MRTDKDLKEEDIFKAIDDGSGMMQQVQQEESTILIGIMTVRVEELNKKANSNKGGKESSRGKGLPTALV